MCVHALALSIYVCRSGNKNTRRSSVGTMFVSAINKQIDTENREEARMRGARVLQQYAGYQHP